MFNIGNRHLLNRSLKKIFLIYPTRLVYTNYLWSQELTRRLPKFLSKEKTIAGKQARRDKYFN